MTVTAAIIKALPSGEFSAIADATVERYIARAEARLHAGTWGDLYDTAVELLTAHMLVSLVAGGQGPAGPVTSEGAGPLSRSYAAPANISSMQSTVYGSQLVELRKELGLMGVV
jgi:hypothetical protein